MSQIRLPAVFMRGGTSKGLFFHERDLPSDTALRDGFLLSAFGSPAPYDRQLNGIGGGIPSLSKAIIVRPSSRPDADVEYLHGQVPVDGPVIDYSADCDNLSAAVGPFAIDEGLVQPPEADGETLVRLYNLNSGKLVHSRFPVRGGRFEPDGDFAMPGVSGTGTRIALDYRKPGVMRGGGLFPTGKLIDRIIVDDREIAVTLAAAALTMVWVRAEDAGIDPALSPAEIDADRAAMARLEAIRRQGAMRLGMCATPESAPLANPKVGIVGPSRDYVALNGQPVRAADADLIVRVVSMGKTHKAIPLTGAMCLAAATLATGTIPAGATARAVIGPEVRLGTPSGVLTVGAVLDMSGALPTAEKTIVYASARRLMDGFVYGAG